ncbi:MAG: hypothetical protein IJC25_04495 [Clostridia bacterium]|nr:hypothetical protein [Clostridia bacterium]
MQPYVSVSFSEDWYHYHFGVNFTEDFWSDPIRRTDTYMELSRQCAGHFPGTELGSTDPKPDPVASLQYGHRFVPALFGCEIVYLNSQAPSAVPLRADFDELAELDIPDFSKNDVLKKAFDDAKRMREKYGFVHGWINTGSPLNAAISIFGEDFLACCAAEPAIAQHVLKIMAKTFTRLMYEFSDVVAPPERIDRRHSSYGNCPAIMFSPKMYKEVILPFDRWYRYAFDTFDLHHCGVFDDFAELYTALAPTSMDVGGGSDYRLLRKYFPDTECSYIINPNHFEGKSTQEIDDLVRGIVTNGGPADKISRLRTYGVGRNATDDNVMDLYSSIERQSLEHYGIK